MSAPAPAQPRSSGKTYPASRLRAVAAWHRQWLTSRYRGRRSRELMSEKLGVTGYRPQFDPNMYYGDMMIPFVDSIVDNAVRAAKSKTSQSNTSSLPVVAALLQATSKSRKA